MAIILQIHMIEYPTGTITFLFTDIEGSTKLWELYPDDMHRAMMQHDAVIEKIIEENGGMLVRPRGEGDSRFAVFERAFREFGLPKAIRTDNGVPFASCTAFFGLSRLAVWWLRLGISIERIKPGHPQQNGRHERMHLTLKKEATKPPAKNFLQQQAKFDRFIVCYNQQRPHQALNMRYPAELYSQVAELLVAQAGATVALTGAPAEWALLERVLAGVAPGARRHILPFAGSLPFEQLCALIGAADLTITNNTGPMHIAAALKRPVVAL